MKTLIRYFIFSFSVLLIANSCDKKTLNTNESTSQLSDNNFKAKRISNPPYVLAPEATQLQVYGLWHAGNDYCTWGAVRTVDEFDSKNRWIIDRGDGKPSVNLVVLSFVNPLKLMYGTTDAITKGGIPIGMTPDIVNYFKSKGIRVMLSIGGITYTDDWNTALATDPTQLAINAAAVASELGVGIEIDYEENSNANLSGLQTFISTYRELHPYNANGTNKAARLTIDLAAGDRWLIAICQKATSEWLKTTGPVLDYANAMVPARQPSASGAISNWDEHIDGKPQYVPAIPPLAPCKLTGSLFITGNGTIPECVDFYSSIQYTDGEYVTKVMPNGAGTTSGLLGYMFWAAECPSTRHLCTTGTNMCTGGVGGGSLFFKINCPMPPLRQN